MSLYYKRRKCIECYQWFRPKRLASLCCSTKCHQEHRQEQKLRVKGLGLLFPRSW